MALTHYPVVNKNGELITSAVTNLDLHDISRAVKTYGVNTFYAVTPLEDQQKLVNRILLHWTKGAGAKYNSIRREALEKVCIKSSLDEAIKHIYKKCEIPPKLVVTSAMSNNNSLSIPEFRNMLKTGNPYLLIFGTAWGLSKKIIKEADYILEPINGNTDYNHLSVRSAVAIILDRLVSAP